VRGKSLRIATWNIASNKNFNLIASRIAELDVDICALQEVSFDPTADLPAMFGHVDRSPADYDWHFMPALTPEQLGGGKFEYYGLGLLSRIPLHRTAAFQLEPKNIGPILDVENEPRILQIATPKSAKPILIANTHLAATYDWSMSAVRRLQVAHIANILRSCAKNETLILCGDFNTAPSSSDLTKLREVLPYIYSSNESTYVKDPSRPPIDFFFCSEPLDVQTLVYPSNGLSDHNIVVATFEGEL
jgi:endonuclease/exonuclease/phosphatase family metal-dependent hydrolase